MTITLWHSDAGAGAVHPIIFRKPIDIHVSAATEASERERLLARQHELGQEKATRQQVADALGIELQAIDRMFESDPDAMIAYARGCGDKAAIAKAAIARRRAQERAPGSAPISGHIASAGTGRRRTFDGRSCGDPPLIERPIVVDAAGAAQPAPASWFSRRPSRHCHGAADAGSGRGMAAAQTWRTCHSSRRASRGSRRFRGRPARGPRADSSSMSRCS